MNLILLERDEVTDDRQARLSGVRARHAIDVLRVALGDALHVGVIDGPTGRGRVVGMTAETVDLQCQLDEPTPPRPRVDLLLALPRPKVMKRLWAQLAALGVGRIAITNAEKVERNYFDTQWLEPESYRPLLLEGLQQARDTRTPGVSIHRQFRKVVEDGLDDLFGPALRIVAHPGARALIGDVVSDTPADRIALAIGPEGGWNEFEVALLESRGFVRVGLGARTLRTDTAAVSLMALAHEALRARLRQRAP